MPPNIPALAKRARRDIIGSRKMLLMWLFDHGIDPKHANEIRSRMGVAQCQQCAIWWNELDVEDGKCLKCRRSDD